MYIVRWLLGHPIVAVLVLAAVALLLAPGIGKESNETDVSLSSDSEAANNSTTSSSGAIATNSLNAAVTPAVLKPAETKADISGKEVAVTIDDAKANKIDATIKGLSDSTSQPSQTLDAKKEVSNEGSSSTGSENNNTVPEKSKKSALKKSVPTTATADLGEVSNEEMLLMAREAYWNNGLDEAAQIYKKLIEVEPKVLEHKGELGNVYWRQGFPQKAAELYSEIAIPMIDSGNTERVANMIGFIGLFYPDRASKIHAHIQSTKNTGKLSK
ncbi:MAG: hypothetical protein V3U64_04610 [Cocleimonas sp.]